MDKTYSLQEIVNSLYGKPQKKRRGRPRNEDSDQWQKMTFIVRKEHLAEIRKIAHDENVKTKDILYLALDNFLRNYRTGVLL